ncbi:MAG: acyl-CoA dehydrogenase [Deltaproteobacteria bacterium]|nr:MAG: acyl-CoA dehydrogenase [Deltaproteobacteria bacterium]
MLLFNPHTNERAYSDEKTRELMDEVIAWFENKGLAAIKEDFHERVWNYDFVEFVKEHKVFSTLMTPAGYGANDSRWDTWRNSAFSEILGFYGLTYWYTFQVTMLGLCPIWMGQNEELKHKTAKLLEEGGVFAFGLSEKEHGADIYSSEVTLTQDKDGGYLANGRKYYIGNGNEAAITSVFGKFEGSGEYVFFATDSKHERYECVKNTVAEANYVAEIALTDYPITDAEIMESGPKAWDNMLNTVNVCKFNLGWGSIGLATHAFYEALNHAANRKLYSRHVTDFPHVKSFFTDAYCRLVAMRVFAERAVDYMRSAGPEDRRYLLYDPMVKMKVTTQGEEVIRLLWEVIAAKGFEKDTFFEIAGHAIGMLPKLEGTAHVNMALVVKFMKNFLFSPGEFPEVPKRNDLADDSFLMDQGPTKGLGKVRFHDYRIAYDSVKLPNVDIFKEQINLFKALLFKAGPDERQSKDIDFLLGLGECFTLIAYGQLILESRENFPELDDALLDQIFDFMVRDMSGYALGIFNKPTASAEQKDMAMAMIKAPAFDKARFSSVWENHVYPLKELYPAPK